MKITFIFCSYLMLLMNSFSSFAIDVGKTENYLDKMLRYELDFKEQEKQLSDVIDELNKQLEVDKDNPYLWYLKGRSSWAALYVYEKKDSRHEEFKKLIPVEYEKALALNKQPKILTEIQLHNIHGSHAVLVEAARQYIDLKEKKTTLDRKEHLRLLRETIISALIKQNKFYEALKELDYIDNEFPENAQGETGNIAWRQHYEKEIESQKNKLEKALQQEKTTEPTDPKKTDSATSTIKLQPVVKVQVPQKKDEDLREGDNNKALFIGIILAALLFVGFVVVRRKKK